MRVPNETLLGFNIEEVLAQHCTGQDDHDSEDCHKCDEMQDELVVAVKHWYNFIIRGDNNAKRKQ